MKIVPTYSAEADTAYVAFGDAREVAETIAPLDDLAIDLDTEGRVVGIEFVTASRRLDLSAISPEELRASELIGVTEIAELFGKRKQNVAQHYTRRQDFPKPAAELPTGRYWRRGDVEAWYERSKIGKHRMKAAEELAIAAEWLTQSLQLEERSIDELREEADRDGLSWRAVQRAADAIDVEERRNGDDVVWDLPAEHPWRKERRRYAMATKRESASPPQRPEPERRAR